MNRELAQRPTLAELNRVIGEQSLIMESLCSEHLLGRWIWKSGRVKGEKHAVPWNVQNINTNPVSRKPPTIRAKPRHVVRRAVRRAARYAYATLMPRLHHAYGTLCVSASASTGEFCMGEGSLRHHDGGPRPVRGVLWILHEEEAVRAATREWRARTLRRQLRVLRCTRPTPPSLVMN